MGEVNVHCYSILKELLATCFFMDFMHFWGLGVLGLDALACFPRCNSILFSAEPLSKAREFLESKAHQLEASVLKL